MPGLSIYHKSFLEIGKIQVLFDTINTLVSPAAPQIIVKQTVMNS